MVTINGFPIDAVVSEDVAFDADVTEFPVEAGSNITDHIRVKPAVLSLDGIVSDTPIGPVAAYRDNPLFITPALGGSLPSDDAYDTLWRILHAAETITVETDKRIYENMALQSLAISHTATDGDSLRFKATFKQVRVVTNERTMVAVAVAVPRAAKKAEKGVKPVVPKENSDYFKTLKDKSWAARAYDAAAEWSP